MDYYEKSECAVNNTVKMKRNVKCGNKRQVIIEETTIKPYRNHANARERDRTHR